LEASKRVVVHQLAARQAGLLLDFRQRQVLNTLLVDDRDSGLDYLLAADRAYP
jgi:hypothetical protein